MSYAAFVLSLSLLLAFNACSYLKAKEVADSGFLAEPTKLKEDRERFPFNKVWLKDYSEKLYHQYSEILIAPVDTTHLSKMRWMDTLSLDGQAQVKTDALKIAEYMRAAFAKQIREDKKARFSIVDVAGPETLVLEMAIVQLVPTKAWLNVAGNVASFFLPGSAVAAGLASSGSVAFEGRIRDGESGEIIAMFKDHETDQFSPIGIQDFTWYYHAEDSIDDWAEQFVEIFDTEADHTVADSLPLTFRVW